MMRSVALPTEIHEQAQRHLIRDDGQEDLCFALWNPSVGTQRSSALISELILPRPGEHHVHGNVSFEPEYFERAMRTAREKGQGVVLLHSHLGPGWQGMSRDDINTERRYAGPAFGATGLPLIGLTSGTDGAWSARFWEKTGRRDFARCWCESVRVVGDKFIPTFNDAMLPPSPPSEELLRTVSAWGEKPQADLSRMHVGIIGAGSVGAIAAEGLARMGVSRLTLVDFDRVEPVNRDRLLFAKRSDALSKRLKVELLAEVLRDSATAPDFQVRTVAASVVEEEGFRAALDCDVLFSCVDRPWARCLLNFVAYAHLIPVVDGGIKLTAKKAGDGLKNGFWRAQIAAPTRKCLECLEQYDPSDVTLEQLGMLDDPTYIQGLPDDHHFKRNENVFASSLSLASLELSQFLRMTIPHPGLANVGAQTEHFTSGILDRDTSSCRSGCLFCTLIAKGERSGLTLTGFDHAADRSRSSHKTESASKPSGFFAWFKQMFGRSRR